jgi:hypothetical protein
MKLHAANLALKGLFYKDYSDLNLKLDQTSDFLLSFGVASDLCNFNY